MPEPLKNLFNRESVGALADAIVDAYPAFDAGAFVEQVFDAGWEDRELMDRRRHVTHALGEGLPADYRLALDVLRRALPALSEQGFEKMVFPDFVEVYGLDDVDASLPALETFTQAVSAEFAVRPFIQQDPARLMAQMLDWAGHPSEGVRRLASEGCRPRLPWGIRLTALVDDPAPILPILDRLKDDPSESVRRSVANNLNDISKDHPGVVIDVLRGWQDGASPEVAWITRHALRTLVKKGDPRALALLGYPPPAVEVRGLAVDRAEIPFGGEVTFRFEVVSTGDVPQDLMIDYVLHLMRSNGTHTPKVFKLATRAIAPGETLSIEKTVSFRPVTTRKYYPGAHLIEPQINGETFGRVAFVVGEAEG
jgi:3-methyladenine DNA glycosylase AlkC